MSDSVPAGDTAERRAADFDALYFDTNALIRGNWPAPTLRLENLLRLTGWMKVSVFLPDAVEREIEQHWLREVRDSAAGLISSAENLHRVTRRVGGSVEFRIEDEEALLGRYRKLAVSCCEQFGIIRAPMTTRPLSEFFDIAVRYETPFVSERNKKGKGFQDAVVLASVLEHLKANPQLSGLLVTDDEVFSKVDVAKFMPSCKQVKLKVLPFEETFNALYNSYWDQHVKKPWEEERHNAKKAVEEIEPEIRTFLQSNMDDAELKAGSSEATLKLISVGKVEVSYVNTPLPIPGNPDRSARIAIAVLARCRVLAKRDYWSDLISGKTYVSSEDPSETDVTWLGGIEALAEIRKHKFVNIRLTSLLPTSELGADKWIRQ